MRKVHNKEYHDMAAKRHHLHELKRKNKIYKNNDALDLTANHKTTYASNKLITRRLVAPKEFSFIYNTDESLEFFQAFIDYSLIIDHLIIDMRKIESLTIEVLLYLISLQKINKSKDVQMNISIKAPSRNDLRNLMAQSGFSKYFQANVDVELDYEEILPIQDGETNRKNKVDDAQTCKDAIDFALKFFENSKFQNTRFVSMYNALAEMMTNTDNHAYDEDGELRNWYLFAVKVEVGVAFYFFDNGKGVIKTAKKHLLEKAIEKIPFSFGYESIMKSVLNGEYRSATGKSYRNKGLPEINGFLTNDTVSYPIILTNKVYCAPDKAIFETTKHNFKGTLFVWVLNNEEE